MSFAISAETEEYLYLVAGETRDEAFELLLADVLAHEGEKAFGNLFSVRTCNTDKDDDVLYNMVVDYTNVIYAKYNKED